VKVFSKDDLYRHLEALGVAAGDDLLVHCGMYAFGPFEGGEQELLQALLHYVGPSATVVAPTFTLWLPDGEVYRYDTPSQRMGQLAECIRMHPDAIRSRCPMHNHAAIGPKAKMLEAFSGNFSTGPGSDFELFYAENFKNLFLGCSPKDSGTFLIHAEAMAQVPYREWVTLRRRVQWKREALQEFEVKYFARGKCDAKFEHDDIGVKVKLGELQKVLVDSAVFVQQKLPLGRSYLANVREVQDRVLAAFRENPYLTLRIADGE